MEEERYLRARRRMVERQIEARGITDRRILDAMTEIPRHLFVPETYRTAAYDDGPLPIGEGQTISQPYIVALMTDMLEIGPDDRVLEIGGGSGYQAAILGKLAREVVTIERLPDIAALARRNLEKVGVSNVTVVEGNGTLGYTEGAPFDGIIVTAAAPEVPEALIEQLAEGGRLVIPVGSKAMQLLEKVVKKDGQIVRTSHGGVMFVPLIGEQGWRE
jgi:protein-L-isoaspartate(D-aspartate) O-methyltransferase